MLGWEEVSEFSSGVVRLPRVQSGHGRCDGIACGRVALCKTQRRGGVAQMVPGGVTFLRQKTQSLKCDNTAVCSIITGQVWSGPWTAGGRRLWGLPSWL